MSIGIDVNGRSALRVVYSRLELNGRKGAQFVGYAQYLQPPHYPSAGGIIAAWEDERSPSARKYRMSATTKNGGRN